MFSHSFSNDMNQPIIETETLPHEFFVDVVNNLSFLNLTNAHTYRLNVLSVDDGMKQLVQAFVWNLQPVPLPGRVVQ